MNETVALTTGDTLRCGPNGEGCRSVAPSTAQARVTAIAEAAR